ncbi:CD1375 family protein [Adlercreutzia equolifaciens]|nr:CD1375 family protein [Adlercreutzia equolifaciens]BAN77132.1 hypothetical protein AEQU_1163 [Adlercreutzia equolifaciens DSM 19450]
MAAVYVRLIKAGKMALGDVPARWREAVAAKLEEGQTEGDGA